MPNEMTAAEAAEKLEEVYNSCSEKYNHRVADNPEFGKYLSAVRVAVSCLRKIDAGKYKPVVHAHWAVVNTRKISKKVACSWCGKSGWNFQNFPRCPYCGALMDGKDDSHLKVADTGQHENGK